MSLVQWLIPLQYTQMSHFIISVVLDIYRYVHVGGARKAVLNHGYEITIVLLLYTYCNRLYDFLVS